MAHPQYAKMAKGKKKHHNQYNKSTQSWIELETVLKTEEEKYDSAIHKATEWMRLAANWTDPEKMPPGMNMLIYKFYSTYISESDAHRLLEATNKIISEYVSKNPGKPVKNPYTKDIKGERKYYKESAIAKVLGFVKRYIGTNWTKEQKQKSVYHDVQNVLQSLSHTKRNISYIKQAIENKKNKTPAQHTHANQTYGRRDAVGGGVTTGTKSDASQAFNHSTFSMAQPFPVL